MKFVTHILLSSHIFVVKEIREVVIENVVEDANVTTVHVVCPASTCGCLAVALRSVESLVHLNRANTRIAINEIHYAAHAQQVEVESIKV